MGDFREEGVDLFQAHALGGGLQQHAAGVAEQFPRRLDHEGQDDEGGDGVDAGTAGEGTQNLLCAAQAGAVLAGLAATAAWGWSWLDPAIALLLAGWAVREGISAWHGDDCC